MPDSRKTALFGVLVMLVAAVGPMVGAAAPADTTATTATDGDADFALNPDDGNSTDDNTTDGNVTDGNSTDGNSTDGNVTDGNETDDVMDGNETSSEAAMQEFVAGLQRVIANATNDTNTTAPGRVIASYVVANNPGNAPAHAGPPSGSPGADAANETNASAGGPPEGTPGASAGNGSSGGPPNGTPGGAPTGNETDGGAPGNGGGNGGNGGNGGGNGNGPKQVAATTTVAADLTTHAAVAVTTPFDY